MNTLVSSIKTLKENSDYRISDVIFKRGCRFEHSTEAVLTKPAYENSILKKYLQLNSGAPDLVLFQKCVREFQQENNIAIPDNDELVMHLRMGDVVEIPWFSNTQKYIQSIIGLKELVERENIKKITIVTCFAYQAWSEDSIHLKPANVSEWNYNDEKQQINIETMDRILSTIADNFDQTLKVQSSTSADEDVVYCSHAKYFLHDVRQPGTGGFSVLLRKLNQINHTL